MDPHELDAEIRNMKTQINELQFQLQALTLVSLAAMSRLSKEQHGDKPVSQLLFHDVDAKIYLRQMALAPDDHEGAHKLSTMRKYVENLMRGLKKSEH